MLNDEVRLNFFFTSETLRYSHHVEVRRDRKVRQRNGKSFLRRKYEFLIICNRPFLDILLVA